MSNASTSALHGLCPPPFYDASKFSLEGFVDGRFCAEVTSSLTCCLPCPLTDFLYPPEFNQWYKAAEALNVVGLICMVFLLVTFVVLPPEKTRRHYLSYCLIVAAMFMSLGFVIPFGSKPEQCHDEITPHDMYSSLTCAFSGAFLIAGGLSIAVWIFIRALSMHLQICWDVSPGQKFFYWAQGLGWSVAAAFFTTTITITGVSFRFGDVCHVNSAHSMADFWGPLLAISGAATLIQVSTFVYCIKVYLQSMWSDDHTETQSSTGLPSYTNSVKTRSARAVYRRVRKVLWLQWRGILIVVFILVDVTFFSVVFVWLNSLQANARNDLPSVLPWTRCLVQSPNDPSKCFEEGQRLAINQSTVIAILMMLSVAGIQVCVLLLRWSMITGWVDLFRSKFSSNREFVSLDAKHHLDKNYELKRLEAEAQNPLPAYPQEAYHSPPVESTNAVHSDYFGQEQRPYNGPMQSFSRPMSPPRETHPEQIGYPETFAYPRVEWDPKSSHARGGLGLHPPEFESKF